ncbi:hypothetical protein PFLUV_G00230960 [Perca fluviatilis]|uniref:Uncharacterized protein n=1 Tax=Perca fluviatilis TaxID=8168 RepID=A0A6A5DXV3_PERFL|nr:hypothetical protein PFLUV_G00230960 [Perca fluviatilis]
MLSMMASHIVTNPATVHSLDLQDLDVVEPRVTHINRQVQCCLDTESKKPALLTSLNKNQQTNSFSFRVFDL